jgi:hypothetical protein
MMYLEDDTLGRVDLAPDGAGSGDCGPQGYVVSGFQIGFPSVRAVARGRAIADGTLDDTRFVGARAVSVDLRVDQRKGDPQVLIDELMPFLSPRYRPRLHWSIPGSTERRSLVVRGVDAPVVIAGPKYHTLALSWVAPQGVIEGDETCITINPASDTELGRAYNLTFDRTYPPSLAVGDRLVTTLGNTVTDWRATIFGPCTNPAIVVNGVELRFDRAGGVTLTGGTSLVVDTRERTILLNGDVNSSRYDKANFTDWSWEQLRLLPGDNIVRYDGVTLDTASSMQMCWRSAWL